MKRTLFLLVTGCFWAVMTALLVRREILPYFEFQEPPSYRSYLRGVNEPEITRYVILMSTTHVGDIENLVVPNPDGTYRMRSRTRWELPDALLPGADKNLYLATRTDVDGRYQLVESALSGSLQGLPFHMLAVRRADKMRLTVDLTFFRETYDNLPYEEDSVMSDGIVPYYGGRLKVGKKWRVKTLDVKGIGPSSRGFSASDLYATVEGRTNRIHNDTPVPCYEVVFRKGATKDAPVSHIAYVDDEGRVLSTLLFLGKWVYEVRFLEKRTLTADEAKNYQWGVQLPGRLRDP
jgi:hypothetical protein